MKARVREIVDLLVEMISSDADPPNTEISLIGRLVRCGYHLGEIDAALKTVFALPAPVTLMESPEAAGRMRTNPSARRVLALDERVALSTEAQGVLLRMVDSRLITDRELEETLLEIVSQGLSDIGVPELLLLLMRIIRDEGRLAMIVLNPFRTAAAPGAEGQLN